MHREHPRSLALAAVSLLAFATAFSACGSGGTGGGTGGAPGTGGAGGAGGMDCGECFRAVYCVPACGEEPVQVGCCPCPQGTFDDITCDMDAGDEGG